MTRFTPKLLLPPPRRSSAAEPAALDATVRRVRPGAARLRAGLPWPRDGAPGLPALPEGPGSGVIAVLKPRLLDLFCGAGGAAMGYHRAGFEVVGVDIRPQPRYPFEFHQADALEVAENPFHVARFDVIHASPPCQGYSNLRKGDHPRLIGPVRNLLRANGLPYVIENIQDARRELRSPVRLCGSMFGLRVQRHRMFEIHPELLVMTPPCAHGINGHIRAYYGKKGWLVWSPAAANVQKKGRTPLLRGSEADAPIDMGIDWMTWDELREAVPPAYTEWIGRWLLTHLEHSTVKPG